MLTRCWYTVDDTLTIQYSMCFPTRTEVEGDRFLDPVDTSREIVLSPQFRCQITFNEIGTSLNTTFFIRHSGLLDREKPVPQHHTDEEQIEEVIGKQPPHQPELPDGRNHIAHLTTEPQ